MTDHRTAGAELVAQLLTADTDDEIEAALHAVNAADEGATFTAMAALTGIVGDLLDGLWDAHHAARLEWVATRVDAIMQHGDVA